MHIHKWSLIGIALGAWPGASQQFALNSLQDTVRAMACEQGVPPAFALAVIDKESGFNNQARGRRGEIGASQILPATARAWGFDTKRLSHEFAYNVAAGVSILRHMLHGAKGNTHAVLSSYGGGLAYAGSVERLMRTRYSEVVCGPPVRGD